MFDAIGLHIYSGAWSVGFAENFRIHAHLEEIEGAGLATAEANGWRVLRKPWPLARYAGIDLAYANPPCVGWSTGGVRKGSADPRACFTPQVAQTLLQLNPTIAVMESVPRAWTVSSTGGGAVYRQIADDFLRAGYQVTVLFTDAMLHGAPQRRSRFHLVAHKVCIYWRDPIVQHASHVALAGPAMAGLGAPVIYAPGEYPEDLNNGHVVKRCSTPERQEQYDLALPDERLLDTLERTGIGPRSSFQIRRIDPSLPARTMAAAFGHVHPYFPREITLREGARLCGYPDSYQFVPPTKRSRRLRREDVSQAVMPCIGRYLGDVFNFALRENDVVRDVEEINLVNHRPLAKRLLKTLREPK